MEWPPMQDDEAPPRIVFLLHGRGGSKRDDCMSAAAEALRTAGLVAIGIDLPNHGARCADKGVNADWNGSRDYASTMYSQMLLCSSELSTLLDVLPCFYGKQLLNARYALLGVSLGARAALLHLSTDARVKVAVSMSGSADYLKDFVMKFEDLRDLVKDRWEATAFDQVFPPELQAVVAAKDTVHKVEQFTTRKLLCLNSKGDQLVHWDSMEPFVSKVKAMAPSSIELILESEPFHVPKGPKLEEWLDLASKFICEQLAQPQTKKMKVAG